MQAVRHRHTYLILAALILVVDFSPLAARTASAADNTQQPFICRTQESGLGQPLVDNRDGTGHPVFGADRQLIGYSKNCNIKTQVQFFYYNGKAFKPYDPASDVKRPPTDLKTTSWSGAPVPFVVRVEVGTINRFLYTIAMLSPRPVQSAADTKPDTAGWNKKLVYWLRGGVGIGHQQGLAMWINGRLSDPERELMPRMLEQGYAIINSSGNETGVHYNMRLAGEAAQLTKAHFVANYGQPAFTIGVGGSGGAVQQYLFAQNLPGLLDGGVPIQSYPDMITQTTPISDCPLLGQYFKDEVALNPASPWAKWSSHAMIEGMNASDTARNAQSGATGSTECINGWRMAMPTVINPVYKDARFDVAANFYGYSGNMLSKVKWTHWNDLADIYGVDQQGFAPNTVDNVGVQYGLGALARGQISADEFLRLNACIGGWKDQADFVDWDQVGDPFDSRNMKRSAKCRDPDGPSAPRRAGDLSAMQSAMTSGQVFTGQRLGIPMVDLRPYLEPELNMHNARQSFSVRARLQGANPAEAKHQVIWFTRTDKDLAGPVMSALAVVERYLSSGKAPAEFVDKCLHADGTTLAAGASVWDGVLNNKAPGACTKAFPIYSSPRMEAGGSIKGDVFKCTLKPLDEALADGTYSASVRFTAEQQARLKRIFPSGVCAAEDNKKPASL